MSIMDFDRQFKRLLVILGSVLLAHVLVLFALLQIRSKTEHSLLHVTTTAVRLITTTPNQIKPIPPKPLPPKPVKPKIVPMTIEQPQPKPLPILVAPIAAISPVAVVVEKQTEKPTPTIPQAEPSPLKVVVPEKTEPAQPKVVKGVAYLVPPRVNYPESERMRGVEGVVIVRVLINAKGTVDEVKIERSSGSVILDREALRTVRNARYRPYSENGVAITVSTLAVIDFSLDDE